MIQNDSENGLTKNQNLQDWSKSRNCRVFHSDNFHKGATMSKRQPWDWMGWEQSWKFLIKCHFGQLNNLSQFEQILYLGENVKIILTVGVE